MTYRLAPAHPYPAGSADVADALRWLHAHIAAYGGDPDAITLAGHSAGATHVACYAARTDLHARAGSGVNGLVLMSGNYEFVEPSPQAVAYFGSDPAVCAQASAIAGVVASELPTLLVISEFDSLNVHRQTKLVADAMYEHDGRIANLLYLPRHNHISMLSHLNAAGTGDSLLSDRLAEFIRICCARSAQPLPA
jgi:triacylglycerol lipase